MVDELAKSKLKEILSEINSSEMPLDALYEHLVQETGGKIPFSDFRTFIDSKYSNINKSNLIN